MAEYNDNATNGKKQRRKTAKPQEPLAYPFRSGSKSTKQHGPNGGGSLGSGYAMQQMHKHQSHANSNNGMHDNQANYRRPRENRSKGDYNERTHGVASIKNGNVIVMQHNAGQMPSNGMRQTQHPLPNQGYKVTGNSGLNGRPPFGMPTAPRAPLGNYMQTAPRRHTRRSPKRQTSSTPAKTFDQVMQYSSPSPNG